MTALLDTTVHHSVTDDEDPWGRRLSAAALVALPVVTLAILLLLPADADLRATTTDHAEKALAATVAHRDGVWIGFLLIGALYFLVVPALQSVLQVVTGRGRALVRVGAVLASVGACALAVEDVIVGVSLRAATSPGLDHDSMVAYTVALQKEHGPLAPMFWMMLPFIVGVVVMAVGMFRSPALRWWHAVLLPVAMIGIFGAQPGGSGFVACALLAAFAAAMLTRSRQSA